MIERPQFFVTKFQNPNLVTGFSSYSQALQTDSDAPFRLFGIAFYVFNSTSVPQAAAANINVLVEFTRPDGTTFFQRHTIPAQAIQPYDAQAIDGAGGQSAPYYSYFSPVNPNQLYPPKTVVTFDFVDVAGVATSTVVAVLIGTKIFADGAVWAPQYPAKYSALPFDGYAVQIPVSALPLLNTPLTIEPDADFVFQKGAQTDYGVGLGSLSVIILGEVFCFTLTAKVAGAITFAVTGFGTPNLPFAITVIGQAISVQLNTDGAGNAITTVGAMYAALNATPAVTALVSLSGLDGPANFFNSNYGPNPLTGGASSVNGQAKGLGIILRDWTGKSYMNDYVPVELIFGFDNSQTPGLIYPEIYIPRVQQLFMDVAGLVSGLSYPATLTLTFKGMKVYRK